VLQLIALIIVRYSASGRYCSAKGSPYELIGGTLQMMLIIHLIFNGVVYLCSFAMIPSLFWVQDSMPTLHGPVASMMNNRKGIRNLDVENMQ